MGTIDAVTCSDPVDSTAGIDWHIRASGTVTGCGQEAVYLARKDGLPFGGLQCGSWELGMFDTSCIALDAPTTTTWSIEQVAFPLRIGESVDVEIRTGSAATLATIQTICR